MNYPQEKIKPYNADEKKSVQVEKMFDNIAPAYDQLNHALSWNIDKSWRRKAINWLKPFHPQYIGCVESSARSAYDKGYRVIVINDCTATDTQEEQDFCEKWIFPKIGKVMNHEEFLEALE